MHNDHVCPKYIQTVLPDEKGNCSLCGAELLLYHGDLSIVLNALKVYQALLQKEARLVSTSFFHWKRCGYCRKREQCPEIEELELTEDHVKEIAGFVADLLKPE